MLGLGNTLSNSGRMPTPFYYNNYSLLFDGVDDNVLIPLDLNLALTNDFTLSVWCYPTSTGGVERMLDRGTSYYLTWGEAGGGGSAKFEFTVYRSGPGPHYEKLVADSTSSLNQWYHVVGTTSGGGGSGVMSLYVDGAVAADGVVSLQDAAVNATNFDIGSYGGGAGGAFEGYIDEVAVWDTALSESAVTSIYNSGSPIDLTESFGNYPGGRYLIAWWRCGDGTEAGSGSTIYDMSGSTGSIDGALSGAAYSTNAP